MSGFRRYGRKPIKCAVRLCHSIHGDIVAETSDISENGVFIRSKSLEQVVKVGDTIDAKLFSSESESSDAQLRVVRTTGDGVGLSFD